MKKKTGIILASCVAAAAIIGCAIWYFAAGNNNTEDPKNAQSVSNITDGTSTPAPTGENTGKPANTSAPQQGGQKPAGSAAPKATQEVKKVTPTFMYFVTNADWSSGDTQKVVDELKKEYEGKINFDIQNVDADPTLLERFAFVKDNTPALIMLNTTNDISKILLQNPKKAELKDAIDAALK